MQMTVDCDSMIMNHREIMMFWEKVWMSCLYFLCWWQSWCSPANCNFGGPPPPAPVDPRDPVLLLLLELLMELGEILFALTSSILPRVTEEQSKSLMKWPFSITSWSACRSSWSSSSDVIMMPSNDERKCFYDGYDWLIVVYLKMIMMYKCDHVYSPYKRACHLSGQIHHQISRVSCRLHNKNSLDDKSYCGLSSHNRSFQSSLSIWHILLQITCHHLMSWFVRKKERKRDVWSDMASVEFLERRKKWAEGYSWRFLLLICKIRIQFISIWNSLLLFCCLTSTCHGITCSSWERYNSSGNKRRNENNVSIDSCRRHHHDDQLRAKRGLCVLNPLSDQLKMISSSLRFLNTNFVSMQSSVRLFSPSLESRFFRCYFCLMQMLEWLCVSWFYQIFVSTPHHHIQTRNKRERERWWGRIKIHPSVNICQAKTVITGVRCAFILMSGEVNSSLSSSR